MAGAAPGPRTALLIAAEGPSHPLYPGNGTFAVVRAQLIGNGVQGKCLITAPDKVAESFKGQQPLFFQGRRSMPTWLQVRATYAGEPREIDLLTYTNIWREWWFRQGGFPYQAERTLSLRTDAEASMQTVWELFLHLRDMTLRKDDESAQALDALMRAASGRYLYDRSVLASLRNAAPNLARLVLRTDGSFNSDVAGVLRALTEFDVAALSFEQPVTLVPPWHTRKV